MKRSLLIALFIVSLTASYGFADREGNMMGSGMMGGQGQEQPAETPYGGGYYPCPMGGPGMMGGYGMGPGMMGGYGMGPGMMGGMMGPGMMGGYGMGPGMMGGYGMGPGMMGGYGMGGYKAEDYQKYMDETSGLRKELHNKRFEYFETLRNPNAKQEDLSKIQKEMLELQEKLNKKWSK